MEKMPTKAYPFQPVRMSVFNVDLLNEIDDLRRQAREREAPWQQRHEAEIKGALLFVEPRYRNYPVMHKEDL